MHLNHTPYDPHIDAEIKGIHITYKDPGANRLGLYIGTINGTPFIMLKPGMSARVERCVLAHEIIHAEHDDQPTCDPVWNVKRENRCDRIAAQRLIDPKKLQQVVAQYDDPGQWANELDVTGWILNAWLTAHYGAIASAS